MRQGAKHRRLGRRAIALSLVAALASSAFLIGCAPREGDRRRTTGAEEGTASAPAREGDAVREPFTVDSTVGDVVNHPAFAGFGRLVLPLDGSYDEAMSLRNVASLLPYHTNVDPVRSADTLNAMIARVDAGETIFYHIYSAEERAADPSKEASGLFFFRGEPGAPYAVICPGGGFTYVGTIHEGFPHAQALSERGYNAFAIKYRVRGGRDAGQMANEDLAAALEFIDEHASEFRVDRAGYSVWGSSAGARMATSIGARGAAAFGGSDVPRPAALVIAYTGDSGYSPDEPPTFAIAGEHDTIAPPAVMARRTEGLRDAGVEAELRVFPDVGHGFGLGEGTSAEGWIDEAAEFWDRHR